ncbi:hypothetical protein DIURU_002666 [Diutina rugosa]|uniref:Reverse transcriptase Ty1/copia-type domain-containing protein n=1 Tax=Diutina rugosa TaxID=5481 RepID=A0A642UPC8_DIURU|nr:uncharacterized protein DIURU_002666 [Diutina rugosa]KAA8902770.1 hypothetical protein DIURU_002666 [Diutina rugosa]
MNFFEAIVSGLNLEDYEDNFERHPDPDHPSNRFHDADMNGEIEWEFSYEEAVDEAIEAQHGVVWESKPTIKNKNDANIITPVYDFVTKSFKSDEDEWESKTKVFLRASKPVAKSPDYSPSQEAFRLVLALTMVRGFSAKHYSIDLSKMDVSMPEIEPVYIHHPSLKEAVHSVGDDKVQVHRLIQPIHGLKNAERLWYNHFRQVFVEKLKFKDSKTVRGIYVYAPAGESKVIALVSDDNIILCGKDDDIDKVETQLEDHFSVTKLGELRRFFGADISYNKAFGRIEIGAWRQIFSLVSKYKIKTDPKVQAPLAEDFDAKWQQQLSAPLLKADEKASITAEFKKMIAELIPIHECGRSDITYAVTKLASLEEHANQFLIDAVKRLRVYLANTADEEILLTPNDETRDKFKAYISTTFDELDKHKATIGYIVLKHGPISWRSKPIEGPELDPIEAEIQAQAMIVDELLRLNEVEHFIRTGEEYDRMRRKKVADEILSNGPDLGLTLAQRQFSERGMDSLF